MRVYGNPQGKYLVVLGHPSAKLFRGGSFEGSRTEIILHNLLNRAGIDVNDVQVIYAYWNTVNHKGLKGLFVPKTKVMPCHLRHEGKFVLETVRKSALLLQDYVQQNSSRITCCIPMHDIALWMLTGEESVSKWRSSYMVACDTPTIPTYDPITTDKMYEWTFLAVHDLKRAKRMGDNGPGIPQEYFTIAPSFQQVTFRLKHLLKMADAGRLELGNDIETRWGQITCIGLAWSDTDCICIPFHCLERPEGYWTLDEELEIVLTLRKLFAHPNVYNVGQNFNYDRNYIVRSWCVLPQLGFDTMCAWHVCYPGLKKSLAFICSMMLPYYQFWKDEGGHHAPKTSEEQDNYWFYNCKDATRTLRLAPLLRQELKDLGQEENYAEQQVFHDVFLNIELRGVKQNVDLKNEYHMQCFELLADYERWFEQFTEALTGGIPLVKSKTASPWYRSPKQQCIIFYDLLKIALVKNPKTGARTVADQALATIAKREPLVRPICEKLVEYNSLGTFYGTFVKMPLDWDKRARSSYGVGMTETFRCTSSADNFGYGGNLQNIPTGY